MADLTKKAIAEGLKELCHHKDFNKISVRDITEQCGLNRQTFYYHFQDKYELLDWIYYQEGFVYLASDVTFDNWHQHMEKLLTMMRENQIFYENTISASPQSRQVCEEGRDSVPRIICSRSPVRCLRKRSAVWTEVCGCRRRMYGCIPGFTAMECAGLSATGSGAE